MSIILNIRYDYKPEVFVPITNYETYSISNHGRVFSTKSNKFIGSLTEKGYRCVNLSNDEGVKGFLIHQLVAIHFISNPNNYPIINHEDGNPLNCYYENLIWCTVYYNNIHKEKVLKTANHKQLKLNDDSVLDIYRMAHGKEFTLKQISEMFNISETFVSSIKNGKKYNNLTHHIKVPPISFITMEKENELDFGNNMPVGEDKRSAKLNNIQAVEIYRLAHSGEFTNVKLAKMYNVSDRTIGLIKCGTKWKHVTKDIIL